MSTFAVIDLRRDITRYQGYENKLESPGKSTNDYFETVNLLFAYVKHVSSATGESMTNMH